MTYLRVGCVTPQHATNITTTQLTCGTFLYELLKYLLCTFKEPLLAKRLASAEHGLVVLRISRKRFLRRLLRTLPILALDVTCRHVCIDLLDELICLIDARRGSELCIRSKFRMRVT